MEETIKIEGKISEIDLDIKILQETRNSKQETCTRLAKEIQEHDTELGLMRMKKTLFISEKVKKDAVISPDISAEANNITPQ